MDETSNLREAFNEVADAMESYFEGKYGTECGMSCGGMLRVYRDLLTEGKESSGEGLSRKELDARAEKLMYQFVAYFLRKRRERIDPAQAATSTYPPPYDP